MKIYKILIFSILVYCIGLNVQGQNQVRSREFRAVKAIPAKSRSGNSAMLNSLQNDTKKNAGLKLGAERMDLYLPYLKGKRVGICANQTSLVGKVHLVDTLLQLEIDIAKIFCPEHGFRGEAEAGAHISSGIDPETGLPIVSLYGSNRKPTKEQVSDLDIILFDLQDVGCRFYTYISTLHYVMEAAAENGIEVIVLDRPNPNGDYVAGPVLDTNFRSFVGMHPVPVVHGMTMAEYAQMINGEGWLSGGKSCHLRCIEMTGYTHRRSYSLPVSPSPNLQNDKAIRLYPSLCFFEGTAISVGRGTGYPFELYGAPDFADGGYEFMPRAIKGVAENPPYKGELCRGRDLRDEVAPQFTLHYLIDAYQHYKGKEFFTNAKFFDKLAGGDSLRKMILAGKSEEEITGRWQAGLEKFKEIRAKYLLYAE